MKILHIANGMVPAMARELSKLGEYYYFDWTQYMEFGDSGKILLTKDLIKVNDEFNPDITFIHVQRHGVIDGELARKLKGFVINYTYDVIRPIPEWFFDVGNNIGLTLFCDENDVKIFKDANVSSDFMLSGYDNEIFKPDGVKGEYGDIIFLGNVYHEDQNFPLTGFRNDMVDFLKKEYGDKFKVYGNGWKYNDGNLMYREGKEAECYRSCKIGINVSHFDLDRYTSDRMFRIMGSGSFCLTKWYPGIEKDFIDGEHLRIWKNFEELKTLIDYYLINNEERNSIAQKGQKHVFNIARWEIIMKKIIEHGKVKHRI
jgi:hypothetical protein